MKIAWFTPLRRRGSGIAVFSAAACAALSETHEVVVFASDGIHESTNAEQEEFGTGRLKELLSEVAPFDPGYTIAQRIVKATDEYGGVGRPPHDDRTLLILRVVDDSTSDFSKLPIIY